MTLNLTACSGGGAAGVTSNATGSSVGTGSGSASGGGSSGSSGGSTATSSGPNVSLAWQPPTQNTDGSALTDLKGYKIHYGTASQSYTQVISLNNPGLAAYVVQNLPAGSTYYFAVTAYNSAGIESLLSDEVSATVN